jgi:hypothetical protein
LDELIFCVDRLQDWEHNFACNEVKVVIMNGLDVFFFNKTESIILEIELHSLSPLREPINALINNLIDAGDNALRVDDFMLDFLVETMGFDKNAGFVHGLAFAFGGFADKGVAFTSGTGTYVNGLVSDDALESGLNGIRMLDLLELDLRQHELLLHLDQFYIF